MLKEKKVEAVERRKQEIKEAKSMPKPSVESPVGTGNWPPRVHIIWYNGTDDEVHVFTIIPPFLQSQILLIKKI